MSRMFNLPNQITLGRIMLALPIIVLLYFPGKLACLAAVVIFFVACISDLLDGHLARQSNQVTSFGKFLDPLADKVLISSAMIMLVQLDWLPAWIAIVIICRELMITGLRAIAVDEGVVIAADKYGKFKTILQMLALGPLILHYPWFGLDPVPLGFFLLYIALALTVFSGVNYLRAYYLGWSARRGNTNEL